MASSKKAVKEPRNSVSNSFVGAALSWLLFGIQPGVLFVPAILLMVLGSYLSLPEKPDQTKTVRPEGRTDNN